MQITNCIVHHSCGNNGAIVTLQTICMTTIIRSNYFKGIEGTLKLYSVLQRHLDNPLLFPIKKQCIENLRAIYPVLLNKFGYEELSLIIEAEDLLMLQQVHEESILIKSRFNYLKGTVLEPVVPTITEENLKSGFFPLAALVQGVQWPKEVNPAKREEFLCAEEFENVFKMSKEQFKALDKYMRERLKKELKLF